jgi:hypothetical protein
LIAAANRTTRKITVQHLRGGFYVFIIAGKSINGVSHD